MPTSPANPQPGSHFASPNRAVTPALQQAQAHCQAMGVQLTPIRLEVLRLLLQAPGGLKAYELLDQVRAFKPGATPPTVYRALGFLVGHGLVHKISRLSLFKACVLGCHGHDHPGLFLVCPKCQTVAEVSDHDTTHRLIKTLNAMGYQLQGEEIELGAVCPQCAVA